MLNDLSVAMGAVRDQVFAIIGKHERECHDGETCVSTRASVIGWLAHCLGVRGDAWRYAKEVLREYDAECEEKGCHGEEL